MSPAPCILWRKPDPEAVRRLPALIKKGLQQGNGSCRVFFRADDIAHIDESFEAMVHIFKKRRAPLALALVPAWLDEPGWLALLELCGDCGLWTWHQHGQAHLNHEVRGKKQEFGPARSKNEKESDIARGKAHLSGLLGERLSPIFTPPWNRVDLEALESLKRQGFCAVSRGLRPKTPAVNDLLELPVSVDPHTRKETSPAEAWQALEAELVSALASGLCGVMLHHKLMNRAALDWLDALLAALDVEPGTSLVSMADLLP